MTEEETRQGPVKIRRKDKDAAIVFQSCQWYYDMKIVLQTRKQS